MMLLTVFLRVFGSVVLENTTLNTATVACYNGTIQQLVLCVAVVVDMD